MKECFKCHRVLPLGDFYKHKQMADGRLNKCKECAKSDNVKNRAENVEHYRKYDRERGNRQPDGYLKEYREKYPNKYRAHNLVSSAIRSGKLFSESCEGCGAVETHAHHDDYLKPLNVRWLCAAHHSQWHDENGEGKNAS